MLFALFPISDVLHAFLGKIIFTLTIKQVVFHLPLINVAIVVMNDAIAFISVIPKLALIVRVFLEQIPTLAFNHAAR